MRWNPRINRKGHNDSVHAHNQSRTAKNNTRSVNSFNVDMVSILSRQGNATAGKAGQQHGRNCSKDARRPQGQWKRVPESHRSRNKEE